MPNAAASDQLCETLQSCRELFIRRATRQAIERGATTLPDRLADEIGTCLDALTVAVDLGMPTLFANHVALTLPALHPPLASYQEVDAELWAIRQTLLEELPIELLGCAAVHLIEATQRLREVAEHTYTHAGRLRMVPPALLQAVPPELPRSSAATLASYAVN